MALLHGGVDCLLGAFSLALTHGPRHHAGFHLFFNSETFEVGAGIRALTQNDDQRLFRRGVAVQLFEV